MMDKEQVVENIQEPQTNAPKPDKQDIPLEVYDIANLKFKCHCCGNEQIIDKDVKGGIRFDLYTTNKHKLVMACSQCKAMLEMSFEKGESSGIVDIDGQAIPKSAQNGEVTSPIEGDVTFDESGCSNVSGPAEELAEETPEELAESVEMPEEVKQDILESVEKPQENEVTLQKEDIQEESV